MNNLHLRGFESDKPLSQLSTFGIGGPARLFVEVHTVSDLQEVLRYCHRESLPFFVLGKGSNSLFHDQGFNGLVIANKITFCQFEWPQVKVGAGYSFSLLGTQTARQMWSGLEFASGIPGSVGGAVYMNAGANGSEVCQVVSDVTYVTEEGEIEVIGRDQIQFSYRTSSFQMRKGAIASVTFSLIPSDLARSKQLKIIEYRTKTQPYHDKSVGCVFRNPESQSAGALIEKSGLKGTRIGGAEVSDLHANFIVNKGGATAADILELAHLVRHVVKEKLGIELEMEMRCIPYEVEK